MGDIWNDSCCSTINNYQYVCESFSSNEAGPVKFVWTRYIRVSIDDIDDNEYNIASHS